MFAMSSSPRVASYRGRLSGHRAILGRRADNQWDVVLAGLFADCSGVVGEDPFVHHCARKPSPLIGKQFLADLSAAWMEAKEDPEARPVLSLELREILSL
jgi:hypothetical protein